MNTTPTLALAAIAAAVMLSACGKKEEAPAAVAPTAAPAAETVAAACGKVTVANMNWQSAEVLANIDDIILTKGYGCEVELVPGDTMPTLTAMMEKGQPDVQYDRRELLGFTGADLELIRDQLLQHLTG